VIGRVSYDLAKLVLKVALQLWPLWLFWFSWQAASALWRDLLVLQPDPAASSYLLLYRAWPSAALLGPILLMALGVVAHRLQFAGRTIAIAGILGVLCATALTAWPEWLRLSPYLGNASPLSILRAMDGSIVVASAFGLVAAAVAIEVLRGSSLGRSPTDLQRAPSDNHGHADWLSVKEARKLFPGPDPEHGGIVVGEAYRVDLDRVARRAFDPDDRRTWGQGGTAPLLVDPCRSGPTHALVIAGSGGYKTTSVGVPTLLSWTGSVVVLDPSREVGPMVGRHREAALGHRVLTLDPSDTAAGSFNVLDWIDIASPLAEANVEAVVGWISGETGSSRNRITSGAEFFKESGKALISCILADTLWDETLSPDERSLKRVRQVLVTPEHEMRDVLKRIHQHSRSAMARDLAGTIMGLVAETFSGVYANANRDTRWLSTPAYADLVSGSGFRTSELCAGKLTIFVQIPLKVLQATPALGRVVIGALLNAVYEADGKVRGRVLFLLDEVARLGFMGVIETARDAGRKYGITLLLLYQSLGQLVEQWGREGKQAWYDSTSWRLFAAVQDPDTATELSRMCGEHGVMATSQGDTSGTSGRIGALGSNSSGRSENRSELGRALIRPDELLQDTRADEAFVIVRGSKPIRCGRAIYFRRPDMASKVEASRFGQRPEAAE